MSAGWRELNDPPLLPFPPFFFFPPFSPHQPKKQTKTTINKKKHPKKKTTKNRKRGRGRGRGKTNDKRGGWEERGRQGTGGKNKLGWRKINRNGGEEGKPQQGGTGGGCWRGDWDKGGRGQKGGGWARRGSQEKNRTGGGPWEKKTSASQWEKGGTAPRKKKEKTKKKKNKNTTVEGQEGGGAGKETEFQGGAKVSSYCNCVFNRVLVVVWSNHTNPL